MDRTRPTGSRPRLVVVYGHRSLDVTQIRAGARDWCDLVWLVDAEDPQVSRVRPMLERSGTVVDALGEPPAEAAEALRPHAPDGLATFYDTGMEHVAEIARELELSFHAPAAALCLEDKLHQREALRAAGLPTPGTVALPEDADRTAVERIATSITYPAVLKPRRGSGSWHTFPVPSVEALGELWEELAAEGPEAMLVEEYLPDGAGMPGGFEANYVSVESVAQAGRLVHLAITGRFPLAPPLRETGFFIPGTLAAEQEADILEVAGEALRALGFEVGAAHTEIKLTSDGPRVIEVNGRIGGGIPDMLSLAAGVDIVELTLRAAVGLPVDVDDLPPTHGVAYRFFYLPPTSARRLISIDGLDRLNLLPGVKSVALHYPPGSAIDARHGTRSYVFAVVGVADDYAGMLGVEAFMADEITATYEDTVDLPYAS